MLQGKRPPKRNEYRYGERIRLALSSKGSLTAAFLPMFRKRGNRHPRLTKEQMNVVGKVIEYKVKKGKARTATEFLACLDAECSKERVEKISYDAAWYRFTNLPAEVRAHAALGNRGYHNALRPVAARYATLRSEIPGLIAHVDSTQFDARVWAASPLEQLPDTFQIQTTLDLGEQKWLIASATPPTKAEFRKSGKVTLRLRRQTVGFVNPSELLYSLATISNDLPALAPAPSLENVLVVHEDDWRQIEFVSRTQEPQVLEELASIRHVFETQRVGLGFKTTHVRRLIAAPFLGEAHHLADIKRDCHIAREYAGVAFSSTAAIVRGGFAFSTSDGFTLWGQAADDGVLIALCVRPNEATKEFPSSGPKELSQRLNMLLVDWPRAEIL